MEKDEVDPCSSRKMDVINVYICVSLIMCLIMSCMCVCFVFFDVVLSIKLFITSVKSWKMSVTS